MIGGVVAMAGASASAQWAGLRWELERLGFTDAEHTLADGRQISTITEVTPDGLICGVSSAAYSNPAYAGQSCWTWTSREGITRLGLLDGPHRSSEGRRDSMITNASSLGIVSGSSVMYIGARRGGLFAWCWTRSTGLVDLTLRDTEHTHNGVNSSDVRLIVGDVAWGQSTRMEGGLRLGTTVWSWTPQRGQVVHGYRDAAHTSADGYRYSEILHVSRSGVIAGRSNRYSPSRSLGRTGWVWIDAQTYRVGPEDDLHTNTEGTRSCEPRFWIDDEFVGGEATTYNDEGNFGQSVWVQRIGGVAERIGFIDELHISTVTGLSSSDALLSAASGAIAGVSSRYASTSGFGQTAWIWTPGHGTTQVGLVDELHTSGDGVQSSAVGAVSSNSRWAVGTSRIRGGDGGTSVWAWSREMGSIRIGLTDAQHTEPEGTHTSATLGISPDGLSLGTSRRVLPSGGQSAWVWTPGRETRRVGLIDERHTSINGGQVSTPLRADLRGRVCGYSTRYAAGNNAGQSAWVYDPETGRHHTLVFSVATDLRANTTINQFTSEGVVLGSYEVYNGNIRVSTNAFAWSIERGFADLGELVDGGLVAAGWLGLDSVAQGDLSPDPLSEPIKPIVGTGRVTSNPGAACFALVPVARACGADWNEDGFVDFHDYAAFVEDFERGTASVDLNGDGFVDFFDYDAFMGGFEFGC
jgi:hypothetical protein